MAIRIDCVSDQVADLGGLLPPEEVAESLLCPQYMAYDSQFLGSCPLMRSCALAGEQRIRGTWLTFSTAPSLKSNDLNKLFERHIAAANRKVSFDVWVSGVVPLTYLRNMTQTQGLVFRSVSPLVRVSEHSDGGMQVELEVSNPAVNHAGWRTGAAVRTVSDPVLEFLLSAWFEPVAHQYHLSVTVEINSPAYIEYQNQAHINFDNACRAANWELLVKGLELWRAKAPSWSTIEIDAGDVWAQLPDHLVQRLRAFEIER